ncbi:hypothetical protein C8J56DRAFT_922218 [Mycena floridula]|nr:hypothetical protein C8J56DRAFT_922218 [Mycena floridula]
MVEALNDLTGRKIQRIVVKNFRYGQKNLIPSPIFDQLTQLHIRRTPRHCRIQYGTSPLLIPFIASLPSLESLSLESVAFLQFREDAPHLILPKCLQHLTLVNVREFLYSIWRVFQPPTVSSLTIDQESTPGIMMNRVLELWCLRELTHLTFTGYETYFLNLNGLSRLQSIHFIIMVSENIPSRTFFTTLKTVTSPELQQISMGFHHTCPLDLKSVFQSLVESLAKLPFSGIELRLQSRFLDEEPRDLNHLFAQFRLHDLPLPTKLPGYLLL